MNPMTMSPRACLRPGNSAVNPPAKSGGGGATLALFLLLSRPYRVGRLHRLDADAGSTEVRTATAAASALAGEVKASTAASRETASSYEKLVGGVAALRTELSAITQLPARADGLDRRIAQVEASLGALARVAAADMAGRSMTTAASGAVLPQNEVSRLVTLASSIPETAAAAELATVMQGSAISRQSLKADLSHIAGRIEEASAPQPQTTVHTVQTFINRTVTDVGETLGLPSTSRARPRHCATPIGRSMPTWPRRSASLFPAITASSPQWPIGWCVPRRGWHSSNPCAG